MAVGAGSSNLFFKRMLMGPQSFTVAGVMVCLHESVHHMQASLGVVVTDGEGWMKGLQWNGHGSMRPCWRHANVFRKDAGMVDAALGYVDITCSDPLSLRPWTPAQLARTLDQVLDARDRLATRERGWSQARVNRVIKHAGFCPTPTGLLVDLDLRRQVDFLRICAYDWMHTTFQDGWMSNAIWLVIEAISTTKRDAECEALITH